MLQLLSSARQNFIQMLVRVGLSTYQDKGENGTFDILGGYALWMQTMLEIRSQGSLSLEL